MKRFQIALIGLIMMVATISCRQQPQYYQPQAQMGWDGQQEVVRVYDNTGNSFLMNYLIYQQLMNNGGYNNVVRNYYSNPSRYGRPANTSWNARPQANNKVSNFSTSYNNSIRQKKVFTPNVRQQTAIQSSPTSYRAFEARRQQAAEAKAYKVREASRARYEAGPSKSTKSGSFFSTSPRSSSSSYRSNESRRTPSSSSSSSSSGSFFSKPSRSSSSGSSFRSSSSSSRSSFRSSSSRRR